MAIAAYNDSLRPPSVARVTCTTVSLSCVCVCVNHSVCSSSIPSLFTNGGQCVRECEGGETSAFLERLFADGGQCARECEAGETTTVTVVVVVVVNIQWFAFQVKRRWRFV